MPDGGEHSRVDETAAPLMANLAARGDLLRAEAERLFGASGLLNLIGASQTQTPTPISVILPSRNEGARVARTVRSLALGRSNAFPLEVVIVDDASTDGSCNDLPKIAAESPNLSVVVHRLNRWSGIPAARNRGAQLARHPIYVISDANTVYPRNWDVPIRQHFHPSRILAGTIVDDKTGHRGYGLSLELPSMGVRWETNPQRYGGYVPVAACTCTVIGRSLFHTLGGYDETMPLYGAAEPEFSVRAWLSGYEIVMVPDLLVSHRFRPDRERSQFYKTNEGILLKSYVRFACSYLPDEMLDRALRYFSSLMGTGFRPCMAELEREGIWKRRAQLKGALRHDFAWLSRRFNQHETAGATPADGTSTESPGKWIPFTRTEDLRRTVVVIPAYKHPALTRAVIKDCLREPVRVVVVDNSGDHRRVANEQILRPGKNLGWLRANNLAVETEFRHSQWDRVVFLNNDVRLSSRFFAGITWAEQASGASIVAASYDDWWAVQRPEGLAEGETREADDYIPEPRNIPTGACDGTAVSIRREAFERLGLLDAERFGNFGWSGMTDFCYRARAAGMGIIATRAAYVHHCGGGHQTARQIFGDRYEQLAGEEGRAGMVAKWGPDWGKLRNIATQAEVDARFPRKVIVYTAILGDYDQLEPAQCRDVEYVCFTDRADLKVPGWQIRRIDGVSADLSEDERIRLARRFKLLAHEYLPDHQVWIWQDGNVKLTRSPRELVAQYLGSVDIATFQHPKRTCAYQEANACTELRKDSPERIVQQVQRYRAEGFPANRGLVESRVLVRRNTPAVQAFNNAWWAEVSAGSRRDQLSFSYVAWRLQQHYTSMPPEVISIKPHKHPHSRAPARLPRKSADRADLTILLLNWKRPENLRAVIASIDRQTLRPRLCLWNNGEPFNDPRIDWVIGSSQNKLCWPRWAVGAMADTAFVCSLDDDVAFRDERVVADLLSYLRGLDEPDRLVGMSGVILNANQPYDQCPHVDATPTRDIAVDIVKGKLLACRRDTLRNIAMIAEKREDDIAISGLVARGRPAFHRIPAILCNRIAYLPEGGVGMSHERIHQPSREAARRRYFSY